MSKRKNNAIKSPPVVVVHTTHAPNNPMSPDGHTVYPDLIRPQTRLESLSRTVRSLISPFAPSTSPIPQSLPSPSTGGPAHQRSYGSYASTTTITAAVESSSIPEESTRLNAVTWSKWASVNGRTLLLVAYEQSGFHIWDFTQLDNAKEILHLTSIGPVISGTIVSSSSSRSTQKSPVLFLLTGTGDDATLAIYSLALHTFLKRISIPNAKSLQANERFICIGVDASAPSSRTKASSNDTTPPAIHILSSNGDYTHLHTIPIGSISPHTTSSPVFSLTSSRLLAYASSEPPVHLQTSTKTPPSSYPPSNPFTPPSPGSGVGLGGGGGAGIGAANFASGLSVVGSTVLTGAMRLGTGVLEGVKMGINAAGYGSDYQPGVTSSGSGTGSGGGGGRGRDERDAEDARRTVSRSAPAPHVSPLAALAARGHLRRASAQVRSAVSSAGGGGGGYTGAMEGGEWITVLDLQPLLDDGTHMHTVEAEPTIHSPLSPSSSFLLTSPPLTHLAPLSADMRSPDVVVEFPYTSSSSTAKLDSSHTHNVRGSPSKYGSPLSSSRLSPSLHSPSPSNSTSKAVVSVQWSPDGGMLAVGGADGASVRVFGISRGRRGGGSDLEKTRPDERKGEAKLVYELMRGVTPAFIRDIRWSLDGLWCGFVSDKGTLHVYALNPHGGETDGSSQIYGRVLNSAKRPLPTTRVQALARLRQPLFGMDQEDLSAQSRVPSESLNEMGLSALPIFAFLPAKSSRSSSRLPTPPEQRSPPTSLSNTETAPATAGETPPTGFNDTLVFLPDEGRAVLWRCTLRPASSPTPGTKSPASRRIEPSPSIVGDSPGSPTAATGLPSSLPTAGGVLSGVARMTGLGLGEGGLTSALTRGRGLMVETVVLASWDVRRGDSWPEVKSAVWERKAPLDETSRQSYISHAELTTFHLRSSAVSRPIYLSHQFNFSSLMNDYQALVRRLVLDPPTYPVAMRKESVVVRGGDDLLSLHPRDSRISLPGDFDSDANFLGAATNMGPLDLTDSPLLGGHLGLPMEGVPLSSSLASTNVTSHSSQSRSGRRIVGKSFDDGLSSAMESHLQLHASYSPSGSSSDVASPGRVIPMLPNGRPGSSGGGLDAVMRSTARVGKEVWSGLGNVRSPRLMPTKRSSTSADLLKFDEEDEMFMVDGLEEASGIEVPTNPEAARDFVSRREGSLATISPGIGIRYPLPGMTDSGLTIIGPQTGATFTGAPGEEGTWVEQPEVYAQAVEEDARFDDVTKVLEEEREERRAIHGTGAIPASMSSSMVSEPGKPKRKGGKKKRR